MSSIQRQFAQIPNRSRLLYTIGTGTGFTRFGLSNAIAAHPTLVKMYDGTILNTTNGNTFASLYLTGVSIAAGSIYRDMGKQLYVQTNGMTEAIYTYCQLVQGPYSEGVPDAYNVTNSTSVGNVYICTWTNDTTGATPHLPITVSAVRTG